MAIKVNNTTIIDDNRNITNVGIATITNNFNVGVGGTVITTTSGGNVGIGTTNPGATLNVVPTSTSIAGLFSGTTSSDMVRITQLGTGNALVVEDSTNPDVTPFVVGAAGSVGIGTTNPTYKTHILDTAATGAGLLVQGGGAGSPIARFERTVGATGVLVDINAGNGDPQILFNRVGVTTFAIGLNQGTGGTDVFEIASSNALGTNARFVIDSSNGNVGIGTTNPTSTLHVVGNAIITGITTLGTAAFNIGVGGTVLTTTSGGFVGIGTTNPRAQLQIEDTLTFDSATTTTTTTSQVAVDTFATATFRSAKYQVQVTCPGQISALGGITSAGRGYTAGTYNVGFSTSASTGSGAQGTLVISNGLVNQISIASSGANYKAGDVLSASGGSGFQVSVASTGATGGSITALSAITAAGTGYTAGVGVGTTVITFIGGSGTGATGLATVFDGVITSVSLLQQPTTGTGGTVYYAGSNYTTSSVLTINRSDVTNFISSISGDPIAGVSTLTSFSAHGLNVNDTIQFSSTSSTLQLNSGVDYTVLSIPSSTTFTIGTSVGLGTYVGFNTAISARAGFLTATSGIITGITTTSISVGQYIKPITDVIGAGTTVTGIGSSSVFINPASLNIVDSGSTNFDFGSYSFTGLSATFYRTSAIAGGAVTFSNAVSSVATNYQVSDIMVLQYGTGADFIEYATIANNDILGTFSADISGSNARLLITPTYSTNTIRTARQGILV